ncbi:unnamed protein product [Cylicocyclus nassatus]|uniref:Uncharacterized protein n=1 Tax=Cylicocyclus nassatus TaxID=53992 RepID=A0AA36H8N1_CYLNA|nr:unnamed protein product [Cylicocyclus nassatus]
MKSLFWTLGLIAIAAVAFAEKEPEVSKTELSETGKAVLAKLRALRLEEEGILDAITVETDRAIIHSILKTEVEVSNNSDDDSDEVDAAAPRVKRAVRRRGGRRRRAHRRRAVAARRKITEYELWKISPQSHVSAENNGRGFLALLKLPIEYT